MKHPFFHSLAITVAASLIGMPLVGADPGKMSLEEFDAANKAGLTALTAIKPSETLLSKADQTLFFEIYESCGRQLEMSKLALPKVGNADIKAIVQAEIDEQSAVWAKLKEIATAKKVVLPSEWTRNTQRALEAYKDFADKQAEAEYLEETGVNGHQAMLDLMEKTRAQVLDASLRELAVASLPGVKAHLKVAQDQLAKGVDGPVKVDVEVK